MAEEAAHLMAAEKQRDKREETGFPPLPSRI
jgi:hypothetical protein